MSSKPSSNFKPEVPKPVRNIPNPHDGRRDEGDAAAEGEEGMGRHLVVGRDIAMSGDITSCDKLYVEGTIDATMKDGRQLDVAETGVFRGQVTVDEAEVAGTVEGELIVRERLTVRASGRVSGTVRYGEIAIEVGGVIAGDVNVLEQPAEPEAAGGVTPAAVAPAEAPVAAAASADAGESGPDQT